MFSYVKSAVVAAILIIGAGAAWAQSTDNPALTVAQNMQPCDMGDGLACQKLGKVYRYGYGTENRQDAYNKAAEYYHRACELGVSGSCYTLASMYSSAGMYEVSAEYYGTGCEIGSGAACARLARFYEKGEKIDQDYGRAAELYQEACDKGDAGGCTSLGLALANGEWLAKDNARAAALLKRGCELGRDLACWTGVPAP